MSLRKVTFDEFSGTGRQPDAPSGVTPAAIDVVRVYADGAARFARRDDEPQLSRTRRLTELAYRRDRALELRRDLRDRMIAAALTAELRGRGRLRARLTNRPRPGTRTRRVCASVRRPRNGTRGSPADPEDPEPEPRKGSGRSRPAVVVRIELEGPPRVYYEVMHEGDELRLLDWLNAAGYFELIAELVALEREFGT
jgi:hypothetical protein